METIFKQRLKELRIEKSITQQKLANDIHYSLSIVNKWENGKKSPNLDALIVLAKYFRVSADYLIGFED